MTDARKHRVSTAALCCLLGLCAAAANARDSKLKDPLEPARAALRTLQFGKAIELLGAAGSAGNADAEYLLALMYLNGVGAVADSAHARSLLQKAAEQGQGAAAYVLAGELARDPDAPPGAAHQWLERSARSGYVRAAEALKSGRPLLDRESVGASDPALLAAWVFDCARNNDAAELRRLGPAGVAERDEFGRGALSYAAQAGALAAAAALLDLGADLRAVDKAGTTALMIAAERADFVMLDLLLAHGADPQAADSLQRTAVFYAARANRPAGIRILQHAGAALDVRDGRGYNALDAALAVGAADAAAELRSLGVQANLVKGNPGRQTGKFDPAHPGDIYRGWPPLALAVARRDTATVQQLLAAGGDANMRLPQGESLLQAAADAHALEILPLLLAHGANAAAADHSGHSVLWLAAARNDLLVLRALLDAGVKPDAHAASETPPLLAALGATRSDTALALLTAGADFEVTDAQGRTPLMLACAAGQVALVENLLGRHARIEVEDHGGRSALWYAAAAGSRGSVVLLLADGATQERADSRGLTVLHAAAAQAGTDVLVPLLAADARMNRRSAAGDTPLMIAAASGHTEVLEALLAHAPDLDVQNSAGDTALMAASRGGHNAICHMLLTAGANRALRNAAGVSAGDIASTRGFESIAKEIGGKI